MANFSLPSFLQQEQRVHHLHLQYLIHDNSLLSLSQLHLLRGPLQHLRHHREDQVHLRYQPTLIHHHFIMQCHQDCHRSIRLLVILSQVLDLLPP